MLFCAFALMGALVFAQEPEQPHVVLKPAKERAASDVATMALTPGAEKDKDKKTEKPAGNSPEQVQEIKKRSTEWLKTCLGDWDAQTHMSKAEWRTTCQRVSKEREQFLLSTPGAISMRETCVNSRTPRKDFAPKGEPIARDGTRRSTG
jgi:hypothetical protein